MWMRYLVIGLPPSSAGADHCHNDLGRAIGFSTSTDSGRSGASNGLVVPSSITDIGPTPDELMARTR